MNDHWMKNSTLLSVRRPNSPIAKMTLLLDETWREAVQDGWDMSLRMRFEALAECLAILTCHTEDEVEQLIAERYRLRKERIAKKKARRK